MNLYRWLRQTFVLALFLSVAPIQTNAQTKLGPLDGAGLPPADLQRIKVGDTAPDFVLEDQDGKPVQLSKYRGNKSVVLVFYRGYW
jgi:cytochrome oxidase Cu insertion factor (SCO1/SenC/PrrC family)